MTLFLTAGILATLATAALLATPLLRHPAGPAPVAAVSAALLVPAATILLYLAGSNYNWRSPPVAAAGNRQQAAMAPSLADAIAGLEEKLRQQPDDLEGWLLLGNSYLQTDRLDDAERAYQRALKLSGGKNPYAQLGAGEARILADQRALSGEAGQLVEAALRQLPDEPRALWYGGLAAFARGDRALAQSRWDHLLSLGPPEAVARAVRAQMQQLGLSVPRAAASSQPASSGTSVSVRVSIADSLRDQVGVSSVLFVAARDANKPGPPVAALREAAGGLPRTLRLSDANAMIPGRDLSHAARVRLVARISKSGTALPQPGDLYGETQWSKGDGDTVSIVIDRVVKP